jgi:hypothetical protein
MHDGWLHRLLFSVVGQLFMDLSSFTTKSSLEFVYLHRGFLIDCISKNTPFVESVKFKFSSLRPRLLQEFLLWPFILKRLESTYRICFFTLFFWFFGRASRYCCCRVDRLHQISNNFCLNLVFGRFQVKIFGTRFGSHRSWNLCKLRFGWWPSLTIRTSSFNLLCHHFRLFF